MTSQRLVGIVEFLRIEKSEIWDCETHTCDLAMSKSKTAAFTASRLTPTVFKIVEYDDIYSEHPFIYAKICADPKVIMIVDTGCGGASNDAKVDVKSLREFIETWPVEDNGGKPLNEGGKWKYVVVCTHCHYDHIRT